MINENDLINTFVKALRNQNASVFIGSGISSESGSLLWKDLIAKYAEDIGYSVSETDDYPFIAQSYINKGHDEKTFKKDIAQNFIRLSNPTNVHKILARLPIRNYWTTNYDCLMETALQQESKKYDVIYDNDSFYSLRDAREHIVYKCHGDCAYSSSIVITQKDYERFIIDSFNFTHALYNELASSTVLFLGYSFSDPDINNILKVLSTINKTNQIHLFITKREKDESKSVKQNLWILNLERFGIQTLLIDDYKEIPEILNKIERKYLSNKILISGSALMFSGKFDNDTANTFLHNLGIKLVEHDYAQHNGYSGLKIINGNGLGIGKPLYEGVAEAAAGYGLDMANYLLMYPFPKSYYSKTDAEKMPIEKQYVEYRKHMIAQCGAAFFFFGNKKEHENVINASGVKKEFKIAVDLGKYVFPVGTTGYMAKELANDVDNNFAKYNGNNKDLMKLYQVLNSEESSPDQIIDTIIDIIDLLAL